MVGESTFRVLSLGVLGDLFAGLQDDHRIEIQLVLLTSSYD